jgi:hypothetical protein
LKEALFKLDPTAWRNTDGSEANYLRWFHLLMGCKAAGITLEDFIQWCTQDPKYRNDGRVIARKWEGARVWHCGALMRALKEAGIKVQPTQHNNERGQVPLSAASAFDWCKRFNGTVRWLERHPTEADLFSASCLVSEIIIDNGKPKPSIAIDLLLAACKRNGLTSLLGAEVCREKIVKAFRHVEEKFLAEPNGQKGVSADA